MTQLHACAMLCVVLTWLSYMGEHSPLGAVGWAIAALALFFLSAENEKSNCLMRILDDLEEKR